MPTASGVSVEKSFDLAVAVGADRAAHRFRALGSWLALGLGAFLLAVGLYLGVKGTLDYGSVGTLGGTIVSVVGVSILGMGYFQSNRLRYPPKLLRVGPDGLTIKWFGEKRESVLAWNSPGLRVKLWDSSSIQRPGRSEGGGAKFFLGFGNSRPVPIPGDAYRWILAEATHRSLAITRGETQDIGGPGRVDTVSIRPPQASPSSSREQT
jgi:hypothetical protein